MDRILPLNWLVILLTGATVPTIVGMIWYNPKVMGTAWMKATGLDATDPKKFNMAKAIILNTIASIFIAIMLSPMVIHQFAVTSLFQSPADAKALEDANSPLSLYLGDFMSKYGHNFRTFKHGVLHGVLTAILFVGSILAYSCIWERKSFKYWAISVGYWVITLGLMGGIICQWS